MEIRNMQIKIPEGCNIIIGHTHFIKSVEDIYETIVESGTAIKFGIGFCEASGDRLVRTDGNDEKLTEKAGETAMKISAGHTFVVFLSKGFPINILNRIKNVSEVCRIYTATANPLEIIYTDTESGRAILGVSDGQKPVGLEGLEDREKRKEFLRKTGYKR